MNKYNQYINEIANYIKENNLSKTDFKNITNIPFAIYNAIIKEYNLKTNKKTSNNLQSLCDKFNYSIIKNTNDNTVILSCNNCKNTIELNLNNINNLNKCSYCNNNYKKRFLNIVYNKFKNKFSFNEDDIINYKSALKIICPEHGEFITTCEAFAKSKYGCHKCAKIETYKATIHIKEQRFLQLSKTKWNNIYDYSKMIYINNSTQICIICPKHGEFYQTPEQHLHNRVACPECYKEKLLSNIISKENNSLHKIKEHYKDTFNITSINNEIIAICNTCNSKYILNNNNIKKHNLKCHYCNIIKPFINKSNEKFIDEKYSIIIESYNNIKNTITICCQKHGLFDVNLTQWLKGNGCTKCYCESLYFELKMRFIDILHFPDILEINYDINKVIDIKDNNNNIYQYTLANLYKTSVDTINKLVKRNNKKNKVVKVNKEKQQCHLTTNEWIAKAINEIGEKYDYSETVYKNNKTKVKIICHEHGEFWQYPKNHINKKCGCPLCKHNSKLEEATEKFLIENNITFEKQKTFEWLVYKAKQYLDFYLPDYNVAIECQGIQHFKAVGIFDGEEGLINRKLLDENKYRLCKTNNIDIVYVVDKNSEIIPEYFGKIFNDFGEMLKFLGKNFFGF